MTATRLTKDDFPELPGYVTVRGAAEILKIEKPSAWYRVYSGAFKHVYRVTDGDGETLVLLILESEVHELARRLEQSQNRTPSDKQRLTEWNRRVKDWAREQGMHVNVSGQPHNEIRQAYLEAHPNDPQPYEPPTRRRRINPEVDVQST